MISNGALACAILVLAAQANAQTIKDSQWLAFKEKFGKSYATVEEEASRFEIFQKHLAAIEKHKEKKLPYTIGITQYADLSQDEFRRRFLSTMKPKRETATKPHVPFLPQEKGKVEGGLNSLPDDTDWSSALPPVKNQDKCSTCWAFSATAVLEAANQIRKGAARDISNVASLSEQQAIDCVGNGCDGGGWAPNWIEHLKTNNVEVCTESQYPFQDQPGFKQSCMEGTSAGKCDGGFGAGLVTDLAYVSSEDDLLSAVYQQPNRIDVNASMFDSISLYTGGIIDSTYDGPCANSDCTDHSVTVVGYGTDNGVDYWKVRNSWGKDWGESGYFRLKRNQPHGGSMKMMSDQPFYPVVQGEPACPDGYSTDWNYGCQTYCGCNNPDGSHKSTCDHCCKSDDYCYKPESETHCPFGFSKTWNYPCQTYCGCNNPDGSSKSQCDKCCTWDATAVGYCIRADVVEMNVTTLTVPITPAPVVVV